MGHKDYRLLPYTSGLEVGMVFNRYKDLCSFFDQPVFGGKQKQYQMEEWSRYFEWTKDGYKFIITDVYDTPTPYVDGRLTNHIGQYIAYIENILLCYFYVHKKDQNYEADKGMELTTNQLYLALGMINESYGGKTVDLTYCGQKINDFNIRDFYRRSGQKLFYILKSALDNLESRCIIKYFKDYKIREQNSNGLFDYHIASAPEIEMILSAERTILKSMGYTSKVEVYIHNKAEDFFNKCKIYVQAKYNWDGYYSYFRIICDRKWVTETMEELMKDKHSSMKTLNSNIIQALNTQAQSKYVKSENKFNDALPQLAAGEEVKGLFQYPADYVEVQAELADRLIKID